MATAAFERVQPLDVPTGVMRTVTGAGGMPIATHEHGDPQGRPVLFIHGFCQSHLCWHEQYTAPALAGLRMVALDLRGHGESGREVPQGGAPYAPSDYAEDVKAVIDELGLSQPVLVGWSYGGLVIADYVRTCGTAAISGAVFAGAACRLNPPAQEDTFIGPGFLENGVDLMSSELESFIRGTVNFLNACIHEPLAPEHFAWHLAYNMMVPAANRIALLGRGAERFDEEVLPAFDKPAIVIHGREDTVVLPAAGEAIAGAIDGAHLRLYDRCGHAPFYERPADFNRDLLAFLG
jgi:non-heme chloroperoxidase